LTIITWTTQEDWNSKLVAPDYNNDPNETPGDLQYLGYGDSFNNSEISAERWNLYATNIDHTESTLLRLVSSGAGNFRLEQKRALPENYTVALSFDNRIPGTSVYLYLYGDSNCAYILADDSGVSVYNTASGLLASTAQTLDSSSKLIIEKHSSTVYAVYYYDESSSVALYVGDLEITAQPKIRIKCETDATQQGVELTGLDVDAHALPLGMCAYTFNAIGILKSLYLDIDQGPDVLHYIQVTPDGHLDITDSSVRWYGESGIDDYFTETAIGMSHIPQSQSYKYYYKVFFVPAQFAEAMSFLGFSNFVKIIQQLQPFLGYSNFYGGSSAVDGFLGYASYYETIGSPDVFLGYSNYANELIPLALEDTDTMFTLQDIYLNNSKELTGYIIDTTSMDGLAVYSVHEGTLYAETPDGTYLIQSETFTVLEKGTGQYIKIIANGDVHIQFLGVMGIWHS
jgi:hypothetical protein